MDNKLDIEINLINELISDLKKYSLFENDATKKAIQYLESQKRIIWRYGKIWDTSYIKESDYL